MSRRQIVLASGNPGKLKELNALLENSGFEVLPQSHWAVSTVAEDGFSFVENALIKARHASRATGLPAIADDSGLEVDALQGAPGIYSARFAGEDADDGANNRKLLEALRDVPAAQRVCRYQCVIVFLRHPEDPVPVICHGSWEGQILEAPLGTGGFGYDPLFWVPDEGCTAAELPPARKNQLSHRGQALAQLKRFLATL